MSSDLIPISDEQAKAIQEGFKFAGQSLETAKAFGSWISQVLGSAPEDLLGLLGGDWLRIRRAENLLTVAHRSREKLRQRGVIDPEPVTLAVALPLLSAAADEDRDELVELWAKLLAAAQDPASRGSVRQAFIETVKRFEPLDALLFQRLRGHSGPLHPSPSQFFASQLQVGSDAVEVSLLHLVQLGCITDGYTRAGQPVTVVQSPNPTAFGRELYRVLG